MVRLSARKMLAALLSAAITTTTLGASMAKATDIPSSVVLPDDAQRKVTTLFSQVSWHENLPSAEQQAKRDHKMVLWVLMLGKMSGDT